jgi:DNA-binding beta-propeller fold protein YncE
VNRHAKALVAVVIAMIALGASAALALQAHKGGASFDGTTEPSKVPNEAFGGLSGLAVDGSGGDLYVIDTSGAPDFTGAAHRFSESNEYIDTIDGSATTTGSLSLFDPADVAVDSSGTASDGNFYVTDPGNNLVDAFDSSGAPIASFGDSEPPDGQLRGLKTPTGSFSTPCGLAVEPETGKLFVADQNNSKIWIFDSSGAYLEESVADSALQGPCGLAFSSTGEELYVRNSSNGNVLRFHRSGANDYDFAQVIYAQNNGTPENFEDDGPSATDVAVNTTDGHLFIDLGDRIAEFEPFGGQILAFAQGISSSGIAIDSSGGKIYATDASTSPSQIRTFSTATTTLPDATTGAAVNVTGESATLNGSLDALGIETQCEFEYDTAPYSPGEGPHGQSAPCEPAGPYFGAEAVHADITGLAPGTTYHYRLHAESAESENDGADASFATDGKPIVESFSFSNVSAETAQLKAKINPAGAATTYRFEYVEQGEFEANGFANASKAPVPDAAIGEGNIGIDVVRTLGGLTPATKYQLRVVATNAVDVTESPAKALKTFAIPSPPGQGKFPGQGFLSADRAWELVSPPDKLGNDVMPKTTRIRAAADGSAVSFSSFGGFADVQAIGVATDYLAQRSATRATNGWATHAITPPQQTIPLSALFRLHEPFYAGEFSDNFEKGIFSAWSPLTDAPNVAQLPNTLYLREDLRSPGPGSYRLLRDANQLVEPIAKAKALAGVNSRLADTSDDLEHVIFEDRAPLRRSLPLSESDGEQNIKLYKSDGPGVPDLLLAGPNCPGGTEPAKPCSIAATGAAANKYTLRTLSADGSRAEFTTPTSPTSLKSPVTGAASRIFQLDDRGTDSSADDATIQLDASEKEIPDPTEQAIFETASTDGNRVFFQSGEQLTESPGGGLYMWERQEEDETQQVSVDASGGSFTLTAHTQPTLGNGDLTSGSKEVKGVSAGSFMVGQTVSGSGIPAGAMIEKMGTFQGGNANFTLFLTKAATATSNVAISADVEATTPPLPFDASAATVQSALEALVEDEAIVKEPGRRLIGVGNVEVSGGPGSPGAPIPYRVTFRAALAGVNVMQMSADGGALTGGAASAAVATTDPVSNLTLIASYSQDPIGGVVDASEDGHRLYFIAPAKLLPGMPPGGERFFYYWQDADGTPGGTLAFVGGLTGADVETLAINGPLFSGNPHLARTTPDGRVLIFEASDASNLVSGHESSNCKAGVDNNPNVNSSNCSEIYLYRADGSTPTKPDLICASCNPTGAPATASAWIQRSPTSGTGSAVPTSHLSHALASDGRRVFFSTAEQLVPGDTNGAEDVYEYDTLTEEPRLLSSGESDSPSYFADASADGSDVFFLTREQLSGWDVDGNYDLYDARAGGGLPEPPPPPPSCLGDACQPVPAQLDDPTPASASYVGPGNQAKPPGCRKGQRRVKARNGKTRCVKRHVKKSHKRKATNNRRAGR